MAKFWILALFLGVVLSTSNAKTSENDPKDSDQQCSTDPAKEQILREIVYTTQKVLQNGFPALEIPPFDPFLPLEGGSPAVDFFLDDDDSKRLRGRGSVSDVRIENLSSIKIVKVKVNVEDKKIKARVEFPEIVMKGEYDLQGELYSRTPLTGTGKFKLTIKNAQGFLNGELALEEGRYAFADFDYKLKVKDVTAKFDGIYGGDEFAESMGDIINDFGKALFQKSESYVHDDVEQKMIASINKALKASDARDVNQILKTLALEDVCQKSKEEL